MPTKSSMPPPVTRTPRPGDATLSVVAQAQLIRQVRFPKLVLPIASTTAGIANFGFGMIALAGLMLFFPDRISAYLLLIPLIAVVQYVFTLAISFLVASVNVFFRDLGNVVRHVLRLWFYLSPGLYALKTLENSTLVSGNPVLRELAVLNPFAILFEAYRSVIYGTDDGALPTMPHWSTLGWLFVGSVVLLALTTIVFKRLEPSFAKVL